MLTVVLQVTLGPARPASSGMLTGGGVGAFPVLYQDERSLLCFTLNGGLGLFSDGNPWFGQPGTFTRNNPLVQNRAIGAGTGPRASWLENYVEYGAGGAMQLADSPFYVYGVVSGMTILSTGRDIFRSDTRATTNVEKLYAGLIYAPRDSDLRINASAGRQNFTLNEGFLVSQYGSQWNAGWNAGP